MPLVGIGTPPQPPTPRLVCPLPPVSGGRGTLAGEKGVGRVPMPTRGIHCGTLYMYVLCEKHVKGTERRPTYPKFDNRSQRQNRTSAQTQVKLSKMRRIHFKKSTTDVIPSTERCLYTKNLILPKFV